MADTTGPTVSLPANGRRIVANSSDVVRIAIGPSSEDASGRLSLTTTRKVKATKNARAKVLPLGAQDFKAVKGRAANVKITLRRAARKLLRKSGQIRARATLTLRDPAGTRQRGDSLVDHGGAVTMSDPSSVKLSNGRDTVVEAALRWIKGSR